MKRGQAYSFAGKPKDKMISDGPGPGNYMPIDTNAYKDRAPGYSIKGTGPKDPMANDHRNAPGPGQYNNKVDPVREKAPAFTMGGRRGSNRKENAPGPG